MMKSLHINVLVSFLLLVTFNAFAVSGTLTLHNEWGDEVDYKFSNAIKSEGTLDPDDMDTIYINQTSDLDGIEFTYLVDGESFSRTINHTCGYARGGRGSLKGWLQSKNRAAIYIIFPGRGTHPVFICKAS